MDIKNVLLFALLAIVYFVLIFLAHWLYQDYLWFKSVETWVPWFQSFSWWPWKRFVQFIFLFGWEIMWFAVVVFYCKFNRASSTYLVLGICEVTAIFSLFKMYWSHPAPYMDRDYITAIN